MSAVAASERSYCVKRHSRLATLVTPDDTSGPNRQTIESIDAATGLEPERVERRHSRVRCDTGNGEPAESQKQIRSENHTKSININDHKDDHESRRREADKEKNVNKKSTPEVAAACQARDPLLQERRLTTEGENMSIRSTHKMHKLCGQNEARQRQSDNDNSNHNHIRTTSKQQESAKFRKNQSKLTRFLAFAFLLMQLTTDNQNNSHHPNKHTGQTRAIDKQADYQLALELINPSSCVSDWARLFQNMFQMQFVSAQSYRPDWPNSQLQQEIFLLNLEDGYFGCQVNHSQDFLQLFELSRLCDGQNECFLGSDELDAKLKCKSREHCTTSINARGQTEQVNCVNGVCLDGLCYCNDGFGGKSCDVPDENECKYRPCDVFAHCTNTMGSYYCSCFPGEWTRNLEPRVTQLKRELDSNGH